jgi:hypothetical protein
VSNPDLPGALSVPEREERVGHRGARRRGSPLKAGLLGFVSTLAVIAVVVALMRSGGSHQGSASDPGSGSGTSAGAAPTASAGPAAGGSGTSAAVRPGRPGAAAPG